MKIQTHIKRVLVGLLSVSITLCMGNFGSYSIDEVGNGLRLIGVSNAETVAGTGGAGFSFGEVESSANVDGAIGEERDYLKYSAPADALKYGGVPADNAALLALNISEVVTNDTTPNSISVNRQWEYPSAGTAGRGTYIVGTYGISSGTYPVTLNPEADISGITASNDIEIDDDEGLLYIYTSAATPAGDYQLSVTINGVRSNVFTFSVRESIPAISATVSGLDVLQVGSAANGNVEFAIANATYAEEVELSSFTVKDLPEGLTAKEAVRVSESLVRVVIEGTPKAASNTGNYLTIPAQIEAASVVLQNGEQAVSPVTVSSQVRLYTGRIAKGRGSPVSGKPVPVSAPTKKTIMVERLYNEEPKTAQDVEYAIGTSGVLTSAELGILPWQSGTGARIFTNETEEGFSHDETYYVYARTQENENYMPGDVMISDAIKLGISEIVNEGGEATITYSSRTVDFNNGAVEGLFTIDPNAGERTFTLETGGTGTGTIVNNRLTISRVGTFIIGLATAEKDYFGAAGKVTATLNVEPATISISGISAVNKEYDGTTSVSVSGGTLHGVLPGDAVTARVPSTGTMEDASVGENKPVTVGEITLTGIDAAKYELSDPDPGTVTVNVTQKKIAGTVSITVTTASTGSAGRVGAGDTMTANITSITPDATVAYQWYRNGVAVPGATQNTYIVGNAAVDPDGTRMTVRVLGAENYTGEIISSHMDVGLTVLSGTVDILSNSGTEVGNTLTVSLVGMVPSDAKVTYQWYKSGTVIPGATGSSRVIASSDVGTTLRVEVRGSGFYSGMLSDTIDIVRPESTVGIPRDFYASSGTSGSVTVYWEEPDYGLDYLSRYEVQRSGTSSTSWTTKGTDLSHTFTGLTNGTSYTFRVRAVSTDGSVSDTASTTGTPQSTSTTTPSAPTNLTATAGPGQVQLTWSAPSSTGGSTITKYQIRVNSGSWEDVSGTSHTETGLTNGTSYTFYVRAVNSYGSGSETSRSATPQSSSSVPTAPGNFRGTPSSTQVRLTWTAPTNNGGSGITKYEVQRANENWVTASSTSAHTFTGLTNGTNYTFRVRAVNANGFGAQATTTATPSATGTATPSPGAPGSSSPGGPMTPSDDDDITPTPTPGRTPTSTSIPGATPPRASLIIGTPAPATPAPPPSVPVGSNSGVVTGNGTQRQSDGTVTSSTGDFTLTIGTAFSVPGGATIGTDGRVEYTGDGTGATVTLPDGKSFTLSQDAIIILDESTPLGYLVSSETGFTDVRSADWFMNDVLFAYGHSLMVGTSTSPMMFSPNVATTRAMIVTILHRIDGAEDASSLENPFSDVSDGQWYTNAVKWASSNGIVSGVGNGRFDPNATITRQDFAVILTRYADTKGVSLSEGREYPGFSDNSSIASYAADAVERAYRANIVNGRDGNLFDPRGQATRAEASAMFRRFIE